MVDIFKTLESNHEKAIEHIESCLHNKDPEETEFQVLVEYILTTKRNPFAYLPSDWSDKTNNAQLVSNLFTALYHALFNDGGISFPIINGEPRISFIAENDAETDFEF